MGGGFAGLYATLELEKSLIDRTNVEITLINRENFFLFAPMLHEIAAGDLDLTNIVNPGRKLLRKASFIEGQVQEVDLKQARCRGTWSGRTLACDRIPPNRTFFGIDNAILWIAGR